jgi:hypothetical protein
MVFVTGLAGLLLSVAGARWRGGVASVRETRVRIAAAAESERALGAWDPLLADSLADGAAVTVMTGRIGGNVVPYDTLLRMGEGLYFLRVITELRDHGGVLQAREGVARLVELAVPEVPDSQAVAAVGPISTTGDPIIDGKDLLPAGWGGVCRAAEPARAAVRSPLSAPVVGDCQGGSCLSGVPLTVFDTTLAQGFPDRLGDVTLDQLVALGDHRVSGLVRAGPQIGVDGRCDLSLVDNWGDPLASTGPCSRYFSLVVAEDGTRVGGGVGQGVLIGMGHLELGGDLAFHGVVLARGPLTVRDQASVVGTVLAADSVYLGDRGGIYRSTCAVRRAVSGAGRPNPRPERGWFRWP